MSIGDRAVDPSGQVAGIADGQIVAARQHGDACTGGHGAFENPIGQGAAGMARDDDVGRQQRTSSSAPATKAMRPDSLGQAWTSASCSFALEAGSVLSTTRAPGDESSSSSITWASKPCPPPRSTMRPPRKSRRTRLAISHASYSSLRGRHPAWQTAAPRDERACRRESDRGPDRSGVRGTMARTCCDSTPRPEEARRFLTSSTPHDSKSAIASRIHAVTLQARLACSIPVSAACPCCERSGRSFPARICCTSRIPHTRRTASDRTHSSNNERSPSRSF